MATYNNWCHQDFLKFNTNILLTSKEQNRGMLLKVSITTSFVNYYETQNQAFSDYSKCAHLVMIIRSKMIAIADLVIRIIIKLMMQIWSNN